MTNHGARYLGQSRCGRCLDKSHPMARPMAGPSTVATGLRRSSLHALGPHGVFSTIDPVLLSGFCQQGCSHEPSSRSDLLPTMRVSLGPSSGSSQRIDDPIPNASGLSGLPNSTCTSSPTAARALDISLLLWGQLKSVTTTPFNGSMI